MGKESELHSIYFLRLILYQFKQRPRTSTWISMISQLSFEVRLSLEEGVVLHGAA